MALPRPCLDCGVITTNGSRCKTHAKTSARFGSGWQQISRTVLQRDGYRCHWCGGPATTADHLIPRSRGGTNALTNLVAACRPCNSTRGAAYGGGLREMGD